MAEPTTTARVRAACPRWLSSNCHGGPECVCLPATPTPENSDETENDSP